jgi:hypothetical protein
VHVLLKYGSNVHQIAAYGNSYFSSQCILRLALKTLDLRILQALISAGATLDKEKAMQSSLLVPAIPFGTLDIVHLFLYNDVGVN